MPFDAASGNCYGHARYCNVVTGEFTHSNYGCSGSLANQEIRLAAAFRRRRLRTGDGGTAVGMDLRCSFWMYRALTRWAWAQSLPMSPWKRRSSSTRTRRTSSVDVWSAASGGTEASGIGILPKKVGVDLLRYAQFETSTMGLPPPAARFAPDCALRVAAIRYAGAEKAGLDINANHGTIVAPAARPYHGGAAAYDSNNNVVQESGPSGTINYVYNTATQRHTEIPARRDTDYANAVTDIVYGYNNMGELASVTVLKENGQTPAAAASSTIYDALGNTSTTTLPNTVYTYDAGGRLETTLDSATGITTKYTYKPNTNYVQTETVSDPSVSSVNSVAIYSYTYRADGLKTGEVDQTLNSDGTTYDTRTLSWTYDGLDRLTQETSTDTAGVAALNYIDAYGYDLDSNRTTETVESTTGTVTDTITSTYNADDELTKAVDM